MHITHNKLRSRLIGLVAIAATGCQSAVQVPSAVAAGPTEPTRSACQKADSMWNDKILVSRYPTLPPGPGPEDFHRRRAAIGQPAPDAFNRRRSGPQLFRPHLQQYSAAARGVVAGNMPIPIK